MCGCSAVNCSNSSKKGFRVFRFPSDIKRRRVWIQNCRRDKWKPSRHAVLCEAHFEESQYEQKRQDGWKKLKPNAVPTIFNVPNPPRLLDVRRKSVYKRWATTVNNDVATVPDNDASSVQAENFTSPDKVVQKTMVDKNKGIKKTSDDLQHQISDSRQKLRSFFTEEEIKTLEKSKMKGWPVEKIISALKYHFMLGCRLKSEKPIVEIQCRKCRKLILDDGHYAVIANKQTGNPSHDLKRTTNIVLDYKNTPWWIHEQMYRDSWVPHLLPVRQKIFCIHCGARIGTWKVFDTLHLITKRVDIFDLENC